MITGKLLQFQRRDLARYQQPGAKAAVWPWVLAGAAVFAVVGAVVAWVRSW